MRQRVYPRHKASPGWGPALGLSAVLSLPVGTAIACDSEDGAPSLPVQEGGSSQGGLAGNGGANSSSHAGNEAVGEGGQVSMSVAGGGQASSQGGQGGADDGSDGG